MKYIEDLIQEEGLHPGDKMPSQAELAAMMRVSRTSLREAIRTMEGQGLVTVRNGKGMYVGEGAGSEQFRTTLIFHAEKQQLAEALDAREALEKEIIKLAIQNVTDKEIEELREVTEQLMVKFRNGEDKIKEDRAFHFKVYSLCHNTVMIDLMKIITDMLHQYGDPPLNIENAFDAGMPYHEELYQAIRDRDLKRALKANERIIANCRDEILTAEKR